MGRTERRSTLSVVPAACRKQGFKLLLRLVTIPTPALSKSL